MKKMTAFVLALLMAFSLTACGSGSSAAAAPGSSAPASSAGTETPGDVLTVRLAHVVAESTPSGQAFLRFADLVNEKSGGNIQVEVYPNSSLGNNRELLEMVQAGTLEITPTSCAFMAAFTDSAKILDLPFLFTDEQACDEFLKSEAAASIGEGFEEQGFHLMGWMITGFRYLTCNKEVHSPADLKGMKIRVMENDLHVALWQALGASPTTMAFSEVYTALQQKTIDAQENPVANIDGSNVYEVQDYLIKTGHICDTAPFVCNLNWWNSLTDEQRSILQQALDEAIAWGNEETRKGEQEKLAQWDSEGVIDVVELTTDEIRAFQEAAQPVYEAYGDAIGQEMI